jgi:hypothetical protein
MEVNGRWKLDPKVALTVASALITAGILIGNQMAIRRDVEDIKYLLRASVYTREAIDIMKQNADREHDRLWAELNDQRRKLEEISK